MRARQARIANRAASRPPRSFLRATSPPQRRAGDPFQHFRPGRSGDPIHWAPRWPAFVSTPWPRARAPLTTAEWARAGRALQQDASKHITPPGGGDKGRWIQMARIFAMLSTLAAIFVVTGANAKW